MPKRMKILKLDLNGEVSWQYEGQLLERKADGIVLEAFFDRDDMPFMNVVLKRGDRFVEHFYTDRWYNVFEIYDRDDGKLKGWYCNIGYPAVLELGKVSYIDLALDLWVTSGGEQTVLDKDEFLALDLDTDTRTQALAALAALKKIIIDEYFPK